MSRRRSLWTGWTLALLAIVLFANLGLWQSRRAVEKQAMLDAANAVLEQRSPRALAIASDPARAHGYDWAQGMGEFVDTPALLLDNQRHDGRAGVRAYRLFADDDGGLLLVDLGWLPLPGDRRMPAVPRADGRIAVRGLLAPPPSPGLAIGPAMARTATVDGEAWLLTRVELATIAESLALQAPPAARVLRLDPALPLGHARDLELLPNTLPPDKHRGYAVQWFALALAVLATALVLTFRRFK
ncbi:SURF1 family protein [Marilutibacter alkalisoli]|uniref:SURF1-like protein n=1 Tax=Marilutibacter alkalisoli TaxID=2591633 RepID=A0A514BNA4_9GAMM|nr:SURF1 family protein [Lysobacter alkalisoli]QDH68861.1 SURF1 family protein [Lysobacter alkalisoli]